MANTNHRRAKDQVGALTGLRGNNNFVRPDCRRPCHPCHPCHPCGPGGIVHATTDCPECETCSGWPLFYTGPCGPIDDAVECAGACPAWMRYFPASAELVATTPIRVPENGEIRFRFVVGDADMFRMENGRVRLVYPGRYLIAYTAQIPAGTTIDTRLAVTVDDERIFASEVEIEGSSAHTRTYAANALVEAERGDLVALEATNAFEIGQTTPNLPAFTMVITRLG